MHVVRNRIDARRREPHRQSIIPDVTVIPDVDVTVIPDVTAVGSFYADEVVSVVADEVFTTQSVFTEE